MRRSAWVSTAAIAATFIGGCATDEDDRRDSDRAARQSPDTSEQAHQVSADRRILSILRVKNQEEIAAGKLAQDRGSIEQVRSYGEMLVRHHTELDQKVRQTARQASIDLLQIDTTKRMLMRDKGMGDQPPPDHVQELRALSGAEFDRQFIQKMVSGHQELIQTVEQARAQVQNAQVRELLDETLPVLRRHERRASQLASQ